MLRRLFVFAVIATVAGCGPSGPTGPSAAEGYSAQQKFGELSELYSLGQMTLKRQPRQLQDLKASSRAFPGAYAAMQKGEIVVRWGANHGTGTGILAYEKDAATAGGWVLLQNYEIKQLSAVEFAAAPKAGT